MQIRQSDLEAYSRCAQQKRLYNLADAGMIPQPKNLSATVFGTVMHHALQSMETLHAQGREDAGTVAVQTFEHYWHPDNIGALEPNGVEEWLPRQGYSQLLYRGRENLRQYYDLLKRDNDPLLALELSFNVPIVIDGVEHTLHGTLDRLAMRKHQRMTQPYLAIEDFKSGKKGTYLRHRTQWTMYSFASLHPAFWQPFVEAGTLDGILEPLHKRKFSLFDGDGGNYLVIPRRGKWINLHESTVKLHDVGWRLTQDYRRLTVALREYIRACEAGIYPLSISGDNCTYCPFRDGICGGEPVPDESEVPTWH